MSKLSKTKDLEMCTNKLPKDCSSESYSQLEHPTYSIFVTTHSPAFIITSKHKALGQFTRQWG